MVYSFFALEHVDDIRQFIQSIHSLCRDNGYVVIGLPDPSQNVADLLLCDHINHFTPEGLRLLMELNCFEVVHYSRNDYQGAHFLVARKTLKKSISKKKRCFHRRS